MTIIEVITRSLRMLGVIGAGNRAPSADQSADGVLALQSMYQQLIAQEVFGPLTRVLVTENYEAGENELVAADGVTVTITCPVTVEDAKTGETRAPKDTAVISVAGDPRQSFIYDAYFGEWVEVEQLTKTSDAPLADRFNITAMLAVHWAPEFGIDPHPSILAAAEMARHALARPHHADMTATTEFTLAWQAQP